MKFCITALALTTALLPSCMENQEKAAPKPNILFILLDDLGKEWLNVYGSDYIETPEIDKLAATGMKFNNAYSMPQCTPSRIALLTGQYPFRNGWINHYDVPRWGHGGRFDPDKYPGFAKLLQKAGYVTCIAGKWQINDFRLEPNILNEAGFDEYCMWTGAEGGNEIPSGERYWNPYIHTKEGSRTYKGQFGEDIFSDFIIDFMKRHKDMPMLMYYPMCLPHTPFTTTPAEPDVPQEYMHHAMVRYTDFILGKLVKALDNLNIRNNTIIIWTTDNGTVNSLTGARFNNPVQGGKTFLTENGINAPFIVNCPGLVPEGVETDALVDFTDFLPTFAELAHIKPDTGFIYDGRSFASLILGKTSESQRNWALAMGSHPAGIENGRIANSFNYRDRVILDRQYKVYVDTLGQIYEMVDLKNDFYEVNNLIKEENSDIKNALVKFKSVLSELPSYDANPYYEKLENSIFDIPLDELLDMSNKGMRRPNKSPVPTEYAKPE